MHTILLHLESVSAISLQQANQARAAQPGVMAHQPGQGLDVVDEAGIGPIQIAETVQPYVPVERLATWLARLDDEDDD